MQPADPSLLCDASCVRLVSLHLDVLEAELDLLDAQERARAARFATPQLQRRFIAAHTGLRRVLGWAADVAPEALAFESDALGKPALAGVDGLHFSLSHCGGQALVALAPAPVGVDIEALIQRDADLLASQILTPAELGRWRLLGLHHRPEALTEAWTWKEALLKACGLGLRVDPATLTAAPGEVQLPGAARFRLDPVPAAPGHCAALAQSLPARPLRRFRLLPESQLQSLGLHPSSPQPGPDWAA